MTIKINRRLFNTGIAAAAITAPAMPVLAKAPMSDGQMAGVHRLSLGDLEITAISDGHFDLPVGLMPKANMDEVNRLQRDNYYPVSDTIRGGVNTYVVNSTDRTVLVDTGANGVFGPDGFPVGDMPKNLAAAGIEPESIDAIFLTHMHPDHLGGLLAHDGTPAFPNASLHVHQKDWEFWMSEEIMSSVPDDAKFFFQVAQQKAAPYKDTVNLFDDDGDLGGGLSVVPAPGHTPGHAGLRVSTGNKELLILGDIVHSVLLQFAHPDWGIAFDVDQDAAAATRMKLLDMLAADKTLIAGMHIPFPGIGYAEKAGNGYEFVAHRWVYEL